MAFAKKRRHGAEDVALHEKQRGLEWRSGVKMRFGEQLENEMMAAGLVGSRLPWIDYGCVRGESSVYKKIKNTTLLGGVSIFFHRSGACLSFFKRVYPPQPHRCVSSTLFTHTRTPTHLLASLSPFPPSSFRAPGHRRKLKKLRKCQCCDDGTTGESGNEKKDDPTTIGVPPGGDDADVAGESGEAPPPNSSPDEEAAFFSDNDDPEDSNAVNDEGESGAASSAAVGDGDGDGGGGGGGRGVRGSSTSVDDEKGKNPAKQDDNTAHGLNGGEKDDKKADGNKEPCEKCTALFYAELDKGMKATAKAYFGWVSRILSSAPLQHATPWWQKALSCRVSCRGGTGASDNRAWMNAMGSQTNAKGDAPDLSDAHLDIQTEARECLHWIELNGTALRKILKKWDKTNHSTKGRKTLRKYWSDSQYQMLYSPLILELRAVAGMLHGGDEGPHWEDDDLHAPALSYNLGSVGGTSSPSPHEVALLKCGICLDTLYKPIGLACGHVFCCDCLLQTAGVLKHGATFADLRTDPTMVHDDVVEEEEEEETTTPAGAGGAGGEVEDTGSPGDGTSAGGAGGAGAASAVGGAATGQQRPRRRKVHVRKDRCPECRQADVFATSVRLQHVQESLKQVDPEGYKARKAESKKYRSQLKNDAAMERIVKMLLSVATPSGMN